MGFVQVVNDGFHYGYVLRNNDVVNCNKSQKPFLINVTREILVTEINYPFHQTLNLTTMP